jgi:hypothetical protein
LLGCSDVIDCDLLGLGCSHRLVCSEGHK